MRDLILFRFDHFDLLRIEKILLNQILKNNLMLFHLNLKFYFHHLFLLNNQEYKRFYYLVLHHNQLHLQMEFYIHLNYLIQILIQLKNF